MMMITINGSNHHAIDANDGYNIDDDVDSGLYMIYDDDNNTGTMLFHLVQVVIIAV